MSRRVEVAAYLLLLLGMGAVGFFLGAAWIAWVLAILNREAAKVVDRYHREAA